MCSVTFWPQHRGYLLGMNRDERLTRVAGLPPARFVVGTKTIVHPTEPNGGTWISLNEDGVCFALVNWYAIPTRAPKPATSRGDVVVAVRSAATSAQADLRLAALSLNHMNPFRLVGVFEPEQLVCEWRWDLVTRVRLDHDWSERQWLSSGFDEPGAQRVRGATFDSRRTDPDAGTLPWLRRLHSSHDPGPGPFSTCMHRADAATVSYTEVEVAATTGVMRHCAGALCQGGEPATEELARNASPP